MKSLLLVTAWLEAFTGLGLIVSPAPLVTSFISALNDTIDLDATRTNALRTHVPGAA